MGMGTFTLVMVMVVVVMVVVMVMVVMVMIHVIGHVSMLMMRTDGMRNEMKEGISQKTP